MARSLLEIFSEANQQVPSWLQHFASRCGAGSVAQARGLLACRWGSAAGPAAGALLLPPR
jgi:hypothetical protein